MANIRLVVADYCPDQRRITSFSTLSAASPSSLATLRRKWVTTAVLGVWWFVSFRIAPTGDGPLGKSDRALLFGALGLLLGLGVPAGRWLTVVQGLAIVLLLQTVWNRAKNALKEARP